MKTLLLLFLLPLQIFAQDLTGIWTGYLQIGDTKLPYELAISGKGNDLKGYSQLVFTFNGIENIGIKTMDLKVKRGGISIEDGELIYDNYTTPGRRVKLYGSLAWVGKDLNMTLAGTFATRSMDMRAAANENSFKGTVFLQKKNPSTPTKLISKLDDMGLSDKLSFVKPGKEKEEKTAKKDENKIQIKNEEKITPSKEIKTSPEQPEVAQRKTEIIRRITFGSDSIVISLYDNGEIDGDTVSILLNGKVILSKQGLTAKAITKTIYSTEIGDSSELVMYAENLGRIPPNTGLLIIQSGYERYQVRFSGDLQNSSAVILKRRH
ncbi:MAG: hypothetical protein ACHQF0_13335 [Chitinophagales bacterium]